MDEAWALVPWEMKPTFVSVPPEVVPHPFRLPLPSERMGWLRPVNATNCVTLDGRWYQHPGLAKVFLYGMPSHAGPVLDMPASAVLFLVWLTGRGSLRGGVRG